MRLLVLTLVLALVGCGSPADPTEPARRALARGDLQRASDLVEELEGPAAEDLRQDLAMRFERREFELARIEAVLAAIPATARIDVQQQLLALRGELEDRVAKERVKVELSGLAERYIAHKEAARRSDAGDGEPDATIADAAAEFTAPRTETRREPAAAPARPPRVEREVPDDRAWDPYSPAAVARSQREPAVPAVVEGGEVSAEQWADRAARHVKAGELEAAREAYHEALAAAEFGVERDRYAGLARAADDRRLLREELIAAFDADEASFARAGVQEIEVDRVIVRGRELAWSELGGDLWTSLSAELSLSFRARLGLVAERLSSLDVLAAWADLAALKEEGLVDADEVAVIVAGFHGEAPPAQGYVFHGGDWVARSEIEADQRRDRVGVLEERLVKARHSLRDELVEALLAERAPTELTRALGRRWEIAASAIESEITTRRLEKLAEARAELDAAREHALELIFDEEKYFYPYRPPECPPDRARLYAPVQREVDKRVEAVRELWEDSGRAVTPSRLFIELHEELTWCAEQMAELGVEPDGGLLPAWLWGIDPGLEEMGLAEFAWDAEERERLAFDRAVVAWNAERWEGESWPADLAEGVPGVAEQAQVRITNEYRRQMGRRALAWNFKIQAAAQDHSDYMSRTGDFGHFEPEPERKGPGDRMRRRGYDRGAGENCSMVGGAEASHVGWLHSSGHHRNILGQGHREMASGLAGFYWTQNFGTGREFETQLSQ